MHGYEMYGLCIVYGMDGMDSMVSFNLFTCPVWRAFKISCVFQSAIKIGVSLCGNIGVGLRMSSSTTASYLSANYDYV